ncbi:MAG: hypothetical protein KatS3mg105_4029 [Gemmatales bacterium]|nr:MAG: hypothetical protein KatS3mg105_4029 [Gemmatales bacterium]
MPHDNMDLNQLATYLQRDVREISKLVNRGRLPGRKVSGQWRFARAEINHWLETQLPEFDERELSALETRGQTPHAEPLVASLLPVECVAVPLAARTKASVLKELVALAEKSWQVYDPDAILEALKQREEMGSTAFSNGVAIPHPHRPLPGAIGDSILAFGRTPSGIPFGAERGCLTDMFFLVCCENDHTHLQVLARLARLLRRPQLLERLREEPTANGVWQLLRDAEEALLAERNHG